MNRGSENFKKCGFSLISEKCVRTGVPKCGQIRINAEEWAAYLYASLIDFFKNFQLIQLICWYTFSFGSKAF